MRRLLAVAGLAACLAGCGSQPPNHVPPGPGVVDDEVEFPFPVEATRIFEWAREYDIEVVEFWRSVSTPGGVRSGINYNFDGSGMSEEELAVDWRLEIAAMTGSSEDVWWRRGGSERLANSTFLSLVDAVFLRGSPDAIAQAKAHLPSSP